MYRYSVDNAVTYTPSDFILFRESPFAVWMERLNLENPEHGSVPDKDSPPPKDEAQPQDEIVDSLRDEDRDVVLIGWDQDESRRRADTLDAMRSGADFIVNGMLAVGPLAGSANLLMRTSGYSDFGDFLYVPCDTQGTDTLDAAFRLCFICDLLHSMQGQLPPQMLLIREDANVLPLQTEEHIYYYRAVKKRFMDAMRDFRTHRMPDPAESIHFGRWSECARETLRRRAVNPEYQLQETTEAEEELQFDVAQPVARAAGAAGGAGLDVATSASAAGSVSSAVNAPSASPSSAPTLAEQARMLSRDAFRPKAAPGQTPNLARFPRLVTDSTPSESTTADPTDTDLTTGELPNNAEAAPAETRTRGFADETLRDLAFIGSSEPAPLYDSPASPSIISASESPGQDIKMDHEPDVAEGSLAEGSIDSVESALGPVAAVSAAAAEDAERDIKISVEGAGDGATESSRPEKTLVETEHSNDESAEGTKGYFGQDIAYEPSTTSFLEERVGEEFGELPDSDVEGRLGDGSEGSIEYSFEGRRENKVEDYFEEKAEGSFENTAEGSFENRLAVEFADKFSSARDTYALSSAAGHSLANDGSAVSPEDAPAPNLRGKGKAALPEEQEPEPHIEGYEVEIIDLEALDMELREPLLLPPDSVSSRQRDNAGGLSGDSVDRGDSLVDLDSAPPPALTPVSISKTVAHSEYEIDYFGQEKSVPSEALQGRALQESVEKEIARRKDSLTTPALEQPFRQTGRETSREESGHEESASAPRDNSVDTVGNALRNFSSSLITNEDYEDYEDRS